MEDTEKALLLIFERLGSLSLASPVRLETLVIIVYHYTFVQLRENLLVYPVASSKRKFIPCYFWGAIGACYVSDASPPSCYVSDARGLLRFRCKRGGLATFQMHKYYILIGGITDQLVAFQCFLFSSAHFV